MPDSLATQMLNKDLDVPCPECDYPIWACVVEVVVGTTVTCPACRCRVRLVDADGSVQNMGDKVANAMADMVQDLNKAIKGIFG